MPRRIFPIISMPKCFSLGKKLGRSENFGGVPL